jgi:hypothetical protein
MLRFVASAIEGDTTARTYSAAAEYTWTGGTDPQDDVLLPPQDFSSILSDPSIGIVLYSTRVRLPSLFDRSGRCCVSWRRRSKATRRRGRTRPARRRPPPASRFLFDPVRPEYRDRAVLVPDADQLDRGDGAFSRGVTPVREEHRLVIVGEDELTPRVRSCREGKNRSW